ncbi:Transmembrane component NikQ of energizing module of nickel ECF transporter [Rhodovulum sp. PH10]|uniref:cobalt ECF transporter T component CbiQ n=1 Tax=Rhodovulum sp. PH10 TaxID=1187851 RepID=UPI00027C1EDA|nr:cobalt ECF transporter T component CbiQ [Rhodovulum sp. PH10]EJW09731.1 Transmembrane component NikQ of energizing module of nickel ECF transporter [Rhodovulum sp. PH10]
MSVLAPETPLRALPAAAVRPFLLDTLDARTRLLCALAIVLTAITLKNPAVLAALLVALAAGAVLSRLRLRTIGHRLLHLEGFLVVLVLLLPFTVPGEPLLSLGPLTVSDAGVAKALLVLLRVNVAALAMLTLVAGLEPVRLGHALARLKLPHKLVMLLLFAVRYVSLLRAEAVRLSDALRVRGFVPRTSMHTCRTLAWLAGQMLVRAFERAERVDEAMRCRGFSGRFPLVSRDRFGISDAVFAGALGAVLLLALAADRL